MLSLIVVGCVVSRSPTFLVGGVTTFLLRVVGLDSLAGLVKIVRGLLGALLDGVLVAYFFQRALAADCARFFSAERWPA